MNGPLDAIRILDFTRFQQGPYATVLLSDLGAAVIKVEARGDGDMGRSLGRQPDGWSSYFEAHNRNKRSITVDVRKPEGRDIIYKLIPSIDVVTDNFRPGVMPRLGLNYDTLSQINPGIITATASGFGAHGPDANRPSFDSIGQGMGGIMSHQGGGPGRPPQHVVPGLADQTGAIIFALGIMAALMARERQGVGQHIDVSLLGSQVALQAMQIQEYLYRGVQHPTPQRLLPVFGHYRCADDQWLILGVLDPRWWPPFCEALERPDLLSDERFATPHGRFRNREALIVELDAAFARKPRAEWLQRLRDADLPAGPVNDYAALAQEPQVIANEYITALEHPSLGTVRVVGTPIKMSKMPTGPRACAPELGQHTEEILLDLGYAWPDIESLKDAKVI